MYDLRQLGATLPRSLMVMEELRPGFTTDDNAPKFQGETPTGCDRIQVEDAEELLAVGGQLIGANVSDEDQEIWFLTKAGEIIRATGEGSAKFYIVDPEEAQDHLETYADEEALTVLQNLGIFPTPGNTL